MRDANRHLSYAAGAGDRPLLAVTIGQMLDHVVREHGDNEAVVSTFENRRLTYRQFGAAVDDLALALMAIGVNPGDRVGIWSTNCVDWVVVQFATAKIGAILVNINPAYRVTELEFALRQSRCSVLLIGEGFKDVNYAETLLEIAPEFRTGAPSAKLPDLRHVITIEGVAAHAGMTAWPDLLAGASSITAPQLAERLTSLDFDDVINIQYTSGTTGTPKGAMLTHRSILNNGYFVGRRMRLTHRDRLCIPVPFYHCFGMVLANLACATHGATMVLPAPHFSPLATLEAVEKERCTALHGVPTMFVAELDHPRFAEFDYSTLRTGIMAGAPCPIEVMRRVMTEMHLPEITIACGMTETSPVCNMTEVDDPVEMRVGSVGRVMEHQEQKIIDPATGRTVRRGVQGELCYRGYQLMRGYWADPDATRRTIDDAGWLHGGDLAVMDDQGYLRITGRLKDMICRGGEKIFPREVEEFLFTHPAIAEAYVFGVPDEYYGEDVAAWVKLRDGQNLTEEDVRAFCRSRIMAYKVPRRIKFVTEFPTTVTGKIQKYKMRDATAREMAQHRQHGREGEDIGRTPDGMPDTRPRAISQDPV
ncbi:MAG: AMP-binding protein [Phycisphaerae bacterium]|nr:AMP-binding protein [Tepidisphaeraceae bacterium]